MITMMSYKAEQHLELPTIDFMGHLQVKPCKSHMKAPFTSTSFRKQLKNSLCDVMQMYLIRN